MLSKANVTANLTYKNGLSFLVRIFIFNKQPKMDLSCSANIEDENKNAKIISEGLAKIKTVGKVFYNPVQEFNRDLSILVISNYAKLLKEETAKDGKGKNKINVTINSSDEQLSTGIKYEDGISILEALSATGLRSIRYAKEIPGIKSIIANDLSKKAVEDIKNNIKENCVEHLITPSENDASMVMYEHRSNQFDVIDLDPYGCPSIFLDSAVQSVKTGGLLLVTATDMAVLAGNSPETCYSKYGSISLKTKCCHEMAVRILLKCIEAHANRYGRYIEPLLSISADFYVRVFVRVYTSPHKCKFTLSKLSMVYSCTGCGTFNLQPLGILKNGVNNSVKFGLPTSPFVSPLCDNCNHPYHMGGPIWNGHLHCKDFVNKLLSTLWPSLNTYKRIEGILNVVQEELNSVPLYYTLEKLSGTLHIESPSLINFRSAILNAGYDVSSSHMHKGAIKTNAPSRVIWDIMRCWATNHPVSEKRLIEGTPVFNILKVKPEKEYSFDLHLDANPQSRKRGLLRFQLNPLPFWGPGTKSTSMTGEEKIDKSKKNQGKRKRDESTEVTTT